VSVVSGGAAEVAGVLAGDQFLTMDGKDVSLFKDLSPYVALRSGNDIEAVVLRDGQEIALTLQPVRTEQTDFVGGKSKTGRIGVQLWR